MANCNSCGKFTGNPKFCSMSCSASYNNKIYIKRKKLTPICNQCNTNHVPFKNSRRCSPCQKLNKLTLKEDILNRTLQDMVYERNDANKYSRIRQLARYTYRKEIESGCQVCGYSKHAEVCHKKKIADHLPTATIREINDVSNILVLCPNCHWEFDNGILTSSSL